MSTCVPVLWCIAVVGDGAGRPPRNVAETRPGLSSQPTGGTVGSANFMSHAREVT